MKLKFHIRNEAKIAKAKAALDKARDARTAAETALDKARELPPPTSKAEGTRRENTLYRAYCAVNHARNKFAEAVARLHHEMTAYTPEEAKLITLEYLTTVKRRKEKKARRQAPPPP